MTKQDPNIPDWMTERNERFTREREEREQKLRADGYRLIGCVSYRNPSTGETRISMSIGAVETIVITQLPDDHLRYGIGSVIVGPDSDVIEEAADPVEVARANRGAVLTVPKGHRPR